MFKPPAVAGRCPALGVWRRSRAGARQRRLASDRAAPADEDAFPLSLPFGSRRKRPDSPLQRGPEAEIGSQVPAPIRGSGAVWLVSYGRPGHVRRSWRWVATGRSGNRWSGRAGVHGVAPPGLVSGAAVERLAVGSADVEGSDTGL